MAVNVLDHISDEDRLRVGFLTAVRRQWSTEVFGQLRREYAAIVSAEGAPHDLESAGAIIERCPTYGWFGWLERGAQKLKWRTITALVAEHWDELSATFDHAGPSVAVTEMSGELPSWYTSWDIHCQPGGVWGDRSSALVYELGTKVLHIGRNSRNELHELFTRTVLEPALGSTTGAASGGRILDVGCGFGKSTTPIKELLPQAQVLGVDLSEPCIELAAARASQAGLDITFQKANAAALPFGAESVDLVTGTMVLHEMPLPVLRDVLHEVTRVLAPGGAVRFLEFMRTGDEFRDAVMNDHAWRNNEPFMPELMDMDLEAELSAAGLTDARWVPFDERGGGPLAEGFSNRSEWHFPWAVLEARRPA
jgi:ubiquinone/menaquinone biosynthesis C-methylase UbiE